MGIFSKAMKFTGIGQLGKGLRTGATKAARDAKALGQQQLADERAFGDEMRGMTAGGIGMGQDAMQQYYDFISGDTATQDRFLEGIQNSPMYSSMISQGEQAIGRNATATGGFRGGDMQENLAVNSQNILDSMMSQKLQGLSNVGNYGMNNMNTYSNARTNNLAQMGNTRSGIGNVDIAKAGTKQQMIGGAFNMGANALAGGF